MTSIAVASTPSPETTVATAAASIQAPASGTRERTETPSAGSSAVDGPPLREDALFTETSQAAEVAADERARDLARQLVEDALKPYAKLQISKDEDSGQFIYTTIDSRNGEVIRQWPREELLGRLDRPQDADGLVVDRRV